MNFMEKSIILQQLQLESQRNREQMLMEQREIAKIKQQNEFLRGVHEDYKRYHGHIAESKTKYMRELENISEYLKNQMEKSKLSETQMRQAKFEQEKILKDLDKVKMDIDNLVNTSEEIIN